MRRNDRLSSYEETAISIFVCLDSVQIMADIMYWRCTFFFFKQKTAYEMSASLVGSEMCIRDRTTRVSNMNNTAIAQRP